MHGHLNVNFVFFVTRLGIHAVFPEHAVCLPSLDFGFIFRYLKK